MAPMEIPPIIKMGTWNTDIIIIAWVMMKRMYSSAEKLFSIPGMLIEKRNFNESGIVTNKAYKSPRNNKRVEVI